MLSERDAEKNTQATNLCLAAGFPPQAGQAGLTFGHASEPVTSRPQPWSGLTGHSRHLLPIANRGLLVRPTQPTWQSLSMFNSF